MRRAVVAPVAVLAAALAGCADPLGPAGIAGTDVVDASYSVSGGSFTTGGDLVVMLRAFEQDGRVAVCGAFTWTQQSAVSIVYNNFVQNMGVIRIDGATLMQGVSRFPEHPLADDMTGVTARCFLTRAAWRPGFEETPAYARFPRVPFFDDSISGVLTVFRGRPVPDVIKRP